MFSYRLLLYGIEEDMWDKYLLLNTIIIVSSYETGL